MLDINLFRADWVNIREKLRQRNASVEIVDEIIKLESQCRVGLQKLSSMCGRFNSANMDLARLMVAGGDTTELRENIEKQKRLMREKEALVETLSKYRDFKLETP